MSTLCPRCDGERVTLLVADSLTQYVESPAIVCCERCLFAEPESPADAASNPPVARITDRFPSGDGAVALVLLLQQLDSLALNRTEIESLADDIEAHGVDLFLTLNRLLNDPTVEPYLDLARRRDQLEALLYEYE